MGKVKPLKKRPVGRPRADTVAVHVRVPRSLMSAFDRWVKHHGYANRPAGVRGALKEICRID